MEKKRERHFIYKGLVLIMALFVALFILPQRFFSSTQANITVVKPFLLKACLLSFTSELFPHCPSCSLTLTGTVSPQDFALSVLCLGQFSG